MNILNKLKITFEEILRKFRAGKMWQILVKIYAPPLRVNYWEWDKDWPNQLRKGHVWFTDGACNQQGTGAKICKYQSKIQWHISMAQEATAFQAEVAVILDCVTSYLRKKTGEGVNRNLHWKPNDSYSPSSQFLHVK